MRIAFISDIHANFTALQAVLADIKSQGADLIICLGDTVSLGPLPRETLASLKDLKGIYIRGNHDQALLDPGNAAQYEIAEHLTPDLHWCRERLTSDDLEFIQSFKITHEFEFPNGIQLLAFHGSPISNTDIIQSTTAPELLDEYFARQKASVFIGGHSHIQMYRRYGKKLILNSGSVGNAFEFAYSRGNPPRLLPWAEYTIIEQSGNSFRVDLHRVHFDTDALLKIIKESNLPGKAWWLKQYQ
ncbi:MAG: metallophosphoesterase family protein [Anaerolineales bacterium]|nr:metallophosphoesterase family protein [Anaerolineales bacterium]